MANDAGRGHAVRRPKEKPERPGGPDRSESQRTHAYEPPRLERLGSLRDLLGKTGTIDMDIGEGFDERMKD